MCWELSFVYCCDYYHDTSFYVSYVITFLIKCYIKYHVINKCNTKFDIILSGRWPLVLKLWKFPSLFDNSILSPWRSLVTKLINNSSRDTQISTRPPSHVSLLQPHHLQYPSCQESRASVRGGASLAGSQSEPWAAETDQWEAERGCTRCMARQ